jgi:hypothetical protein
MPVISGLPPPGPIEFTYRFQLPDGSARVHLVVIDRKTLQLQFTDEHPPAWTELERNKCSNCPLDAATTPYCPAARGAAAVCETFKDSPSYTIAETEVVTEERTYSKTGALASALGSLFGLVMATSGCPHLSFLRPMARFHLPFATIEDTVVRATSFHLLEQYRKARRGGPESLALDQLRKDYEALAAVNLGLTNRVRSMGGKDSGRNAVVALDAFAKMLHMELRDDLPILDEVFPG